MLSAAQTAVVAIIAAAYAIRALQLARAGRPLPRRRLLCAAAGLAALLASMLLLDTPGRELAYWRTTQRLLMGDLGCMLIAIGLTTAIVAPLARTPLRALAPLTSPPAAVALWVANLVVWQWPSLFDAALHHDSLAFAQDVLLIVTSLSMWRALLRGLAGPGARMSERTGIACIVASRAPGIALACIGIWSPDVYYPYFLSRDASFSVSPLADQGIAGAIMLTEMALIAVCLLLWMHARLGRSAPAPAHLPAEMAQAPQSAGASALAMDAQT